MKVPAWPGQISWAAKDKAIVELNGVVSRNHVGSLPAMGRSPPAVISLLSEGASRHQSSRKSHHEAAGRKKNTSPAAHRQVLLRGEECPFPLDLIGNRSASPFFSTACILLTSALATTCAATGPLAAPPLSGTSATRR